MTDRTPITFHPQDTPMERAQKIWRAIGMANDPANMVPAMAGFLSMYRDWDRDGERQDKSESK